MNNEFFKRSTYNDNQIQILLNSRVGIIGVGGAGGLISELLVRTGIGYLRLIDGDIYDESNLNRQLGSDLLSIGKYKVNVLEEKYQNISKYTKIDSVHEFLDYDNYKEFLKNLDFVVSCVDGFDNARKVLTSTDEMGIPHSIVICSYDKIRICLFEKSNFNNYLELINTYYNKNFIKAPKNSNCKVSALYMGNSLHYDMIIDYLLNGEKSKYRDCAVYLDLNNLIIEKFNMFFNPN